MVHVFNSFCHWTLVKWSLIIWFDPWHKYLQSKSCKWFMVWCAKIVYTNGTANQSMWNSLKLASITLTHNAVVTTLPTRLHWRSIFQLVLYLRSNALSILSSKLHTRLHSAIRTTINVVNLTTPTHQVVRDLLTCSSRTLELEAL